MLALLELAGQAGAAVSLVGGGLAMVVGVPFFAPAMLGALASQMLLRPKREELAATAALALLLALPLQRFATGPDTGLFAIAATALGLASVAVLAVAALRARGSDDRSAVDAFLPAAILPAFALLSYPMVYLTVALWPTTWDHRLYLADLAFGAPLSFVVGRAAAAVPLLNPLCLAVYVSLPLALLVVHALRRRHGVRSADAIVAFVALTTVGWLAYQLVPVAGPVWTFGAAFPLSPPDPSTLASAKVVVVPAPRNCMPSLHSAWALLVWWLARPLPRAARTAASVFLAITLLATVGLGFHYVVDLVAAFPLTTAVHAWATTGRDAKLRRTAMAAGAALTLAWMALATAGTALLAATPLVPWTLAAAVVAVSCVLSSRVHAARDDEPAAAPVVDDPRSWPRRAAVALGAVAASATFVHWAIYSNALGILLGGGASVRTGLGALLLAALAAGLAAAHASRTLPAMQGAASAALLLAAASAASPAALRFASTSALGAADFPASLLSALPLLLPSGFFTGLFAGFLARASGRPALLLEAALPAVAFAALATAYLVMPSLYSSQLPTALQAAVAVGAIALAVVARGAFAEDDAAAASEQGGDPGSAWPLVAVALLAGIALETTGHLRSVVAGDTVHARAHAAIAIALGLALGAAFARRAALLRERDRLAAAALGLAASVALVLPLWPALPGYFASFRDYAVQHATVTTFAEREFVRLALAALTLLPASACAGAALVFAGGRRGDDAALVLERGQRGDDAAFAGRAASATAALAAGIALAAFVLVPFAGSATALALVVLAAALLAALAGRSASWAAASLVVAAPALLASFIDLGALNSGSGLVFGPTGRAPVLEAIETADGLVSAHRRPDGGIEVSVNGRARGDGAAVFAAAAARAPGRGRALLLGLGTGETARRLLEAGFAEVVVAESDEGVVRLAATVFAAENGDVLRDPRVRWSRDDGRRSLELAGGVADFVAIDVPEASAPGAAALLTREASAHAKRRLVPGGLLAQRLDLAELSPLALGSVLAAARGSFAHAALRFDGDDAMMLASDAPLQRLDETAAWLSPEAVDRLLDAMAAQIGVQAAALAASDRDLFLAYQAPKTVTQHADPAQRSLPLLQRLAADE